METMTMATAQRLTNAQKASMQMMCDCQKPIVEGAWEEYASRLEALGDTLLKLPKIYSQDKLAYDAIVYAHYFVGATDFFVTERDGNDMFGYAILNGDYDMAEFGYLSLSELKSIPGLNLDFYWDETTLRDALTNVSDYFNYL